MSTRLIQIILPDSLADRVCQQLDDLDKANWWRSELIRDEREQVFVLAKSGEEQDIMDRIAESLEGEEGWRQVILPVEAVAPELLSEEEKEAQATRSRTAAREEILAGVRGNAALTTDFLLMTALATVVAAIGLNSDQMAAVIGAMVIAPLLGPVMGVALGVALGLRGLILHATLSLLAGFAACIASSAAMALVLPINMESELLDYAQPVGLGTMALALASGAAAALATATAKSSPLVGVMVAAAILPPIAAAGLLLAGGAFLEAARAGFIVVVNLACITLSAQAVFIAKGIRPRRWSELRRAETSWALNTVALVILLAIMGAIIVFWDVI
ncbi:TIGR00341 family protein [Halovulum dunhuangense]|uniref:TIGR00341 family protein n=1 Tax=Halovulum dunhuangense TaxID=1505036 RepID=A0A849L5F4_9RHOB|nr:TIGR00341 family protein [Halovulum dunhuangense]NNU81599.1 TIGR00341 family protein [Halovulum dunhuangense]